jgi:hypothetical protein
MSAQICFVLFLRDLIAFAFMMCYALRSTGSRSAVEFEALRLRSQMAPGEAGGAKDGAGFHK